VQRSLQAVESRTTSVIGLSADSLGEGDGLRSNLTVTMCLSGASSSIEDSIRRLPELVER
jgi:hypothetical protein